MNISSYDSYGALLNVGSGGTTNASGIAQVAGWTLGLGANTPEALLMGGAGAPAYDPSPVSLATQYPVSLTGHRNDPTGPLLGQVTGTSTLPGRRAKEAGVTFRFPTQIVRGPEDSRLCFTMQVTTPSSRRPRLWYNPRGRSDSPCWDAMFHPPTGPPVRGFSILIAN